jgi:hypothetical protein
MNGENTKELKISVPSSMTDEQAQRCFLVGMNMFVTAYKGGVITAYATGENIVNMVFYDKEGVALVDFINAMHQNKKQWEEKKGDVEKRGNSLLEKI